MVLAANAPDVDVLAYNRGEYFGLAFRRGLTHGLPAMVVLPVAVTGLVLAWDRWIRRRRRPDAPPARGWPLLALAFLAVFTHPVLDWMNTYGMRWLMPFGSSWSYGDALFIVDPWIWLVLGAGLVLARAGHPLFWAAVALLTSYVVLGGRAPVAAEVLWIAGVAAVVAVRLWGRPRSEAGGRRAARAACAVTFVYIGLMVISSRLAAHEVAAAARADGIEVRDVLISPQAADPFDARVEVRTPRGFIPGEHGWLRSPRVALRRDALLPDTVAPPGVQPGELHAVLDVARATPDVAHYLVWSRYPVYRVERDARGWRIRVSDVRYGARGTGDGGGLSGVTVRLSAPSGPEAPPTPRSEDR